MGNLANKENAGNNEEKESKCYDTKKIFWDHDGNLRYGESSRNRDEEVIEVLAADDADERDNTRTWMIVPSRWLKQWLLFAHLRVGKEPGKINTSSLVVRDREAVNGYRPKNTLQPPFTTEDDDKPGHYRRITMKAWFKLVDLYGCEGPAIAVRGIPYDDLTRWRTFPDPKNIDIDLLPEPVLPVEEKKEEGPAQGLKSMFDSLF